MRNRLAVSAAVAVFVAASPALAECSVSSDAGAVAKPIDMTVQADANIVVSMSLLPKLMHIDYSSAAGKKPSCDLGQFTAGAASYELYGDDKAGRQRTAKPARKGDPIAQIIPVTDIMKAISASKEGKSATVEGYLLATVTKTDFTGWRYYTGMPDTATLKRDMVQALGGSAAPIFRNGADGKTQIFVPKR
ncbi:hypothetical protein [Sphingomonas sp. CFBP 13733]|uniref:hypothetical protein n=2 Tax=unclassified Sphingomonas TaxID=196159 RepID=UPI001786BB83|nr:hypothetical protein [Sphingomonas sp. CFBP 13733]MBD8641375.1 hypothetical protein [Sphingomonas sp. CFBP 13733]